MGGPPADKSEDTERVRLHITPFNPDLLERIIPPSLRPLATDVCFHTVQTFPERGFGFVELPIMEAQKLKKKLNGSTLKGSKVRVGEAKPEKKRNVDAEVDEGDGKAAKKAKREKRKVGEKILPGHELEEGRRVKRGWTGDDDDSEQKTSKKARRSQDKSGNGHVGSEGRKLRFKAELPPNATTLETKNKDGAKQKEDEKARKGKKHVVVEEFKKTKKSSAKNVKSDGAAPGAVTYEDGRGWIDENGNVVEAERSSRKRKPKRPTVQVDDNAREEDIGQDVEMQPTDQSINAQTSSNDKPTSERDPDEHSDPNNNPKPVGPAEEVHPLEALFKRPASSGSTKAKPTPIDTSFSFFDTAEAVNDEGEDVESSGIRMPPETPHTKQDLEWRSMRSGAPTPDTAAIGRHFSFPFAEEEDDDDDEDGDVSEGRVGAAGGQDAEVIDAEAGAEQVGGRERGEESAFRKWFYENRGDLNRGWKKRRREEKKAKRQSENRKLSQRIA